MAHLITCDLTASTPAARGRQHGEGLGKEIAALYDNYARLALGLERGSDAEREMLKLAMRYWPGMEAYAPELCDEIQGIADGSGVPVEHIVLLNLYDEIGLAAEHHANTAKCTGFAVAAAAMADGEAVVGQNLDLPLWYLPCVLFRIAPAEGETAKAMVSQPGIVGGPGMNTSVAINWVTVIPRDSRFGFPGPLLIRRALQETDLDAAIEVVTSAERAMGSNLFFTDGKRAFNFEGTAEKHVLTEVETTFGHANNYMAPSLEALDFLEEADAVYNVSSCHRQQRVVELLQRDAAAGKITREQLFALLADHDGHPISICTHEEGTNAFETLVSMVLEPTKGAMWLTPGITPCRTPHQRYELLTEPAREAVASS